MSKSPRRTKIKESFISVSDFNKPRKEQRALKSKKQKQMRQENIRLQEERESKMKQEMDFLAKMMANDE